MDWFLDHKQSFQNAILSLMPNKQRAAVLALFLQVSAKVFGCALSSLLLQEFWGFKLPICVLRILKCQIHVLKAGGGLFSSVVLGSRTCTYLGTLLWNVSIHHASVLKLGWGWVPVTVSSWSCLAPSFPGLVHQSTVLYPHPYDFGCVKPSGSYTMMGLSSRIVLNKCPQ